ncbi:hypothetical protein C7974DRAFT_216562 [Boeremia exigua]|uniref:uncharacterized protein n=1 Tax=Boeremia exigua TaxID=749465 RepID=UPI001E8D4F20|nr:uncharacterized protein C7974DRAFT_216562 [Boeremia exigua]KAH6622128.1 hypothetical protein C7974DRAFT_216562 [Boeremia exigua]
MPTQAVPPATGSDAKPPPTAALPHSLAKFKQRSHDTHHAVHIPELTLRLALDPHPAPPLPTPPLPTDADADADAPLPNLLNTQPIHAVYLGNSMLERLKTTGLGTRLGALSESGVAFNAGVGGDKNESVLYRLAQGLGSVLSAAQARGDGRCDIKLWVLCSGTNNLHAKRGLREGDVASWKALLDACLEIAPRSVVLACDVFYRKDIADEVTERANEKLKQVVEECEAKARVVWVEARQKIAKEMLVDHVHMDEKGYEVWDGVLWPYVEAVLARAETRDEGELQ